ncbi:hypothetical protein EW026_g1582 [Hermanssonia centrifuga]|uniref:ubiquitinyl hydrolase 1 n=1 Tax=Hermanssonia centrifuga TaxID=98765 RepID=A0A4S4KVJ8_9APHY|nr:hypothetical protein EW026_g1582 [Hermanssonia centrifuga]
MSTLSISDVQIETDIDAYMADQGEYNATESLVTPQVLVNGISTTTSDSTSTSPVATAITSSSKLQTVTELCKASMQVGEVWYLVSRRWYKRWEKACSGQEDKEGILEEKDLGPVDNTSLVDVRGNLISSSVEGVDVQFVPKQVWDLFVTWYGQPLYPLPRNVIARGITQEPTLELHPPHLYAHLLLPDIPTDTSSPSSDHRHEIVVSSTDSVSALRQAILRTQFSTNSPEDGYRIWKVEDVPETQTYFTERQLRELGGSILEDSDKTVEEALIESGDHFILEVVKEGKWIVLDSEIPKSKESSPAPPSTQTTASTSGPIFSSNNNWLDKLQQKTSPSTRTFPSSSSLKPAAPIKTGSLLKDPRSSKGSKQVPGTLGLGNMGNTCFMNSAVQCLAHTQELAEYFLTGVFEDELNPENPLGMKGAIAEAFGSLLRRIWAPTTSSTSYSPRDFKQVLQRFAPQFSGYQQHDSQELVAFLLDGLHEDLNRVLKKPYVEKPDWEGGGDKELVALARHSWDGYMKRNDSVIVDLFQGVDYFDPFMYLTLPLPVHKKWKHTIFYVPWDLEKPHLKIPVEINRESSFKDLRNLLGRWMDTNPDHLLTLEVFSHRFYKNLDDSVLCSDMGENDMIVCYELPCNSQQSRAYKPKEDDPFIVPVYLCEAPGRQRATSYGSSSLNMFGQPFLMVVDPKEATSQEAVYDLVVERLPRWTTHVRDLFHWEAGSASAPMEEVTIPLTGATPMDSVTEINEDGEVVTVQEVVPEEGDITDQKGVVVQEERDDDMDTEDDTPRRVGYKKGLFNLRIMPGNAQYGVGYGGYGAGSNKFDSWEQRASSSEDGVLVRQGDAFCCEFDENMQAYYWGVKSAFEHATWNTWKEFIHPEQKAVRDAAADRKSRGITLQDCLDEFTKEEQLGEDDLWYCPRCKKHQQATKRFDLWSVPDVLVVHLKRFSNSRALRDKIDTFVDFPLHDLDLTSMVRERQVGERLSAEGEDIQALGLSDINEPLIYDLFAVDEHLGGLGGGHYRAYAYNYSDDKWYHFDDSYVSEARPESAVNANAYLLFYKRRTSRPLGGKTHEKVEAARSKIIEVPDATQPEPSSTIASQLPTPPSEENDSREMTGTNINGLIEFGRSRTDNWDASSTAQSSPGSVPPPLEEAEPPSFEESQNDEVLQTSLDPLQLSTQQFDFPNPGSGRGSPSSMQAEYDNDDVNDRDPLPEVEEFLMPSVTGIGTLHPASFSPRSVTHDDDFPGLPSLSEDELSDI